MDLLRKHFLMFFYSGSLLFFLMAWGSCYPLQPFMPLAQPLRHQQAELGSYRRLISYLDYLAPGTPAQMQQAGRALWVRYVTLLEPLPDLAVRLISPVGFYEKDLQQQSSQLLISQAYQQQSHSKQTLFFAPWLRFDYCQQYQEAHEQNLQPRCSSFVSLLESAPGTQRMGQAYYATLYASTFDAQKDVAAVDPEEDASTMQELDPTQAEQSPPQFLPAGIYRIVYGAYEQYEAHGSYLLQIASSKQQAAFSLHDDFAQAALALGHP